jgi:predicted phage terminase large subunit-like protein
MVEGREQWETICFRGIRRDEPNPLDPRLPGQALWPEQKDEAGHALERAKDASGYDALFDQNPRAPGNAEWPDEYFDGIFYDEMPADTKIRYRVLALDSSKGRKSKSGDYSAMPYMKVDTDLCCWVDESFMRIAPIDQVEQMAYSWVIEKENDGMMVEINNDDGIGRNLARRCKNLMPAPNLFGIHNTENKECRIRNELGALLASHRLRFKRTPDNQMIVRQLQEFPNGTHDDGPDALSICTRLVNHLIGAKKSGPAPLRLQ